MECNMADENQWNYNMTIPVSYSITTVSSIDLYIHLIIFLINNPTLVTEVNNENMFVNRL